MFRASLRPSSGAYQLQQQQPDRPRPTALLPPRSYGKPEAAAAVDRLLMMGITMAETC
jgi:hypothetical protein